MIDKYLAQHPRVASRVLEEEAIILTPGDNRLYTFNSVGTYIWELADGKRKVGEIVTEICEEFDVEAETARRDALEFIENFVQKGILELKEEPMQ